MGIVQQFFAGSLHGDRAALDHVAAIDDGQKRPRVLVSDQDGDAELPDVPDRVDDLELQRRRQPQKRLIQEQQAGLGHERSPDGEHLLLAAAEESGGPVAQLKQNRKQLPDVLEHLLRLGAASQAGADFEILQHATFREDASALGAKDDPLFNAQARFELGDIPAPIANLPDDGDLLAASSLLFDLAVEDDAGDRVHQCRLAGAVGADEADDLRLAHFQRNVVDRQAVLVKDQQVFDSEHTTHPPPVSSPASGGGARRGFWKLAGE